MTRPNVTLEVYNVIDLLYIIMQDPVQDGRISFISPDNPIKLDAIPLRALIRDSERQNRLLI